MRQSAGEMRSIIYANAADMLNPFYPTLTGPSPHLFPLPLLCSIDPAQLDLNFIRPCIFASFATKERDDAREELPRELPLLNRNIIGD